MPVIRRLKQVFLGSRWPTAMVPEFVDCPMDEADRARIAAGLANLYLDDPTPPPTYSHADLSAAWRQLHDARAQWDFAMSHLLDVLANMKVPT